MHNFLLRILEFRTDNRSLMIFLLNPFDASIIPRWWFRNPGVVPVEIMKLAGKHVGGSVHVNWLPGFLQHQQIMSPWVTRNMKKSLISHFRHVPCFPIHSPGLPWLNIFVKKILNVVVYYPIKAYGFLICNRVWGAIFKIFKVKNPSICHSKLYEFPNAPKLSKTIDTFKDLLLFLGKWSVFTSIHVSNSWYNYQLEKNSWWLVVVSKNKVFSIGDWLHGVEIWSASGMAGGFIYSFNGPIFNEHMALRLFHESYRG